MYLVPTILASPLSLPNACPHICVCFCYVCLQYQWLLSKNSQSALWYPNQRNQLTQSNSVRFVDITHPSLYRADAMVGTQVAGSQDCLHPCLPGLPDAWVDIFYEFWRRDPNFR